MSPSSLKPLLLLTLQSTSGLREPDTSQPTLVSMLRYVRNVAVHTSAESAQSLLLLGRHTASPLSSPQSSVHQWLQSSEPMALPPIPVESSLFSDNSELQQALPIGGDGKMIAPLIARTSRAASRSTRHTRRSVA